MNSCADPYFLFAFRFGNSKQSHPLNNRLEQDSDSLDHVVQFGAMNSFRLVVVLVATVVTASLDSSGNKLPFSVRHPRSPHWSRNCPSPAVLDAFGATDEDESRCCCSIIDYGAIGDNSTINTRAIQWTIDGCYYACFRDHEVLGDHHRSLVVYIPRGMFRTGSISLRSNTRLHIAGGGSIYGSDNPSDYPLVPDLNGGRQSSFRALLYGSNLENVSITGEDEGYSPGSFAHFSSFDKVPFASNRTETSISVIDGAGWKWWCKAGYVVLASFEWASMAILNSFLQ